MAEALSGVARPPAGAAQSSDRRETYRREARGALSRFVERLTEVRTPIVCLDDVQYGPESLRWVEQLVDRPNPPGLLVVMTVDEDVPDDPRAGPLLERIRDRAIVTEREVTPLPADEQREFLDRLMVLESTLADRVVEASDGLPLYARELLQDWVARDFLQPSPDGFELVEQRSPVFPDGLTALCHRRLEWFVTADEEIDREQIELALEVGAALGRAVDRQEWKATCRRLEIPDIDDALLSSLTESGLAEWYPAGWRFRHRLLSRVLGQRSRQFGRWATIHRAIAAVLTAESKKAPAMLERRCLHLEAAGDRGRARQIREQAGLH